MKSDSKNQHTIDTRFLAKLILFPCLMFGFGFLLIPLYDVFCDITGLNGKIELIAPQSTISNDHKSVTHINHQEVILQFTSASDNESWEFKPEMPQLNIIPGQQYQTFFHLKNPTDTPVEFTSIPSISPGLAAEYLIKTECFCFQKQILKPNEKVEMSLVFKLRNDIPKEYRKLTLAYRIYAKPLSSKKLMPSAEVINKSITSIFQ